MNKRMPKGILFCFVRWTDYYLVVERMLCSNKK